MGLFKADLYRFFSLGFAAGALFVVSRMDGGLSVIPQAIAQVVQ